MDEQVRRALEQLQSTLPARGATAQIKDAKIDWAFQSTLPARGATIRQGTKQQCYTISIHAPREGSD